MADPAWAAMNADDERDTTDETPSEPSFWQVLRQMVFSTPGERRQQRRDRLVALSAAIERHPDAAANYLLRGELHLERDEPDLARQDLERALALAETQYETDRWGLAAQSIMDRARHALQHLSNTEE